MAFILSFVYRKHTQEVSENVGVATSGAVLSEKNPKSLSETVE